MIIFYGITYLSVFRSERASTTPKSRPSSCLRKYQSALGACVGRCVRQAIRVGHPFTPLGICAPAVNEEVWKDVPQIAILHGRTGCGIESN